MAGLVSNQRL